MAIDRMCNADLVRSWWYSSQHPFVGEGGHDRNTGTGSPDCVDGEVDLSSGLLAVGFQVVAWVGCAEGTSDGDLTNATPGLEVGNGIGARPDETAREVGDGCVVAHDKGGFAFWTGNVRAPPDQKPDEEQADGSSLHEVLLHKALLVFLDV